MSAVASVLATFARSVSDLDTVVRSSNGWRDDQRLRLERAQLIPLRSEANRFASALKDLDQSLDAVQRLLAQ
jgi:hypothetical protein